MTTTEPPLTPSDTRACGCCQARGDHRCGHECSACDGSGVDPDSPNCTVPHGADCGCDRRAPLTPGETVWVEAVALDFDGEAGPVLHVIDAEGEDRATFTEIAFALSRVHWRRMPDDTTAEPTVLKTGMIVSVAGEERVILDLGPAGKHYRDVRLIWVSAETAPEAHATENAAATLAAGVPVGAITDEPEPGAYLIGDLLAVRFPQDTDDSRWAVQGGIDHDWLTWLAVRQRYGDKPMRRLLPHTQPTTATLEVTGEPLTLDAIGDVVTYRLEAFFGDSSADLARTRADLVTQRRRADRAENAILNCDALADERDDMRSQRDNLAAENARLRQQRDEARNEFTAVREERDEALRDAHRADEARQFRLDTIDELERDLAEARRQLREVGRVACELFALPDVPLLTAQDPAQMPGGDDAH